MTNANSQIRLGVQKELDEPQAQFSTQLQQAMFSDFLSLLLLNAIYLLVQSGFTVSNVHFINSPT